MNMSTTSHTIQTEEIAALLHQAFEPSVLEVMDDASLHASHAHAGAGHFRVVICSSMFQGKTKLQIHRMIYTVLERYMENGIHALSIDAKSC